MNVNSRSVFLGCKYAVSQFLRQKPHTSGHRGWIVNTASIMGLVGQMVNGVAYCASKGAVVLITKVVTVEQAKYQGSDCGTGEEQNPLQRYMSGPSADAYDTGPIRESDVEDSYIRFDALV